MIRKCSKCGEYTLEEVCLHDGEKTVDAHYKFKKVRDAPKGSKRF